MYFKNIGKVSEHNIKHYARSFISDVQIGQVSRAKQHYELIFTPEEMELLEKNAFNKDFME